MRKSQRRLTVLFLLVHVYRGLCQFGPVIFRPSFSVPTFNQQKPQLKHDKCLGAQLWASPKSKTTISDCVFLEDYLIIKMDQLTAKPNCIKYIWMAFDTQTGKREEGASVDSQTSVQIKNPLAISERCVSSVKMTIRVKFWSSEILWDRNFDVNPMGCFNSTKMAVLQWSARVVFSISRRE